MLLLWHLLCKNGIAIKQLDADEKESLHNVITAHDRKWSLDIFGMFGLHIFSAWSQVWFVGTTCVKSKQIWASCRIQRGQYKGAVSFPQELRTGECQVFVGQHAATPRGKRVRRVSANQEPGLLTCWPITEGSVTKRDGTHSIVGILRDPSLYKILNHANYFLRKLTKSGWALLRGRVSD